mgnify:CR=1 FL=1
METIGGIGVALAIALESIFRPSVRSHPSALRLHRRTRHPESAGRNHLATIGSVLGAWTLYGISRWVGLHRINLAADKIPGVSRKDVSKANDWFTQYGTWSVLIGRVIPVVRSLISIPAGFNRMNFLHFTGWTCSARPCGTPSSFPPVTCSATSGARFKARSACSRTWSSRP